MSERAERRSEVLTKGGAVAAVAGGLVFVTVTDNSARRDSTDYSVGDETRECIRELAGALDRAGSSYEHLLKVSCFLADDSFRGEFWKAWDVEFAGVPSKPMRLTQVAGVGPGRRVVLDAVSALPV